MEIFFKYVLPILSLIIVFGIPFIYVLLTGKYGKGIGWVWFLMTAWYFILSIPVYHILWHSHKELVIETLPEGNSIEAAVMTGWFPGLIVSGLAILMRKLIIRFNPTFFKNDDNEVESTLEDHNVCYNQRQ